MKKISVNALLVNMGADKLINCTKDLAGTICTIKLNSTALQKTINKDALQFINYCA